MGVSIGVSQSYRAAMANMCACHVLSTPRSLAPLELRDGRPLGCLRAIAFPLRSPHPSPKMARRVLTPTGVPALKDAPRSTSTSALHHQHRPACDHDAGHGRAATPWTSEALERPPGKKAREPQTESEELLRMTLLLTQASRRSPGEHLRSTFTYVGLSEEGRSVHFYVIFYFT